MKYPKLQNYNWLHTEYIDKQRTTVEIAKELGVKSANSVRQALKRFDIKIRNNSEAHVLTRIDDHLILNLPVLEGSLLGDASLTKFKKRNTCLPHLSKKIFIMIIFFISLLKFFLKTQPNE